LRFPDFENWSPKSPDFGWTYKTNDWSRWTPIPKFLKHPPHSQPKSDTIKQTNSCPSNVLLV
jgi:hypothetical protein